MFDAPKSREITQGTVFSCAHSENYDGADVLGLVITARCDAAQDKVPVFSYVPVVSLLDWIFVDGAALALDRAEADCMNSLKSLIKTANLSDSLLRTHDVHVIYDVHFASRSQERSFQGTSKKFREVAARLTDIRYLQNDSSDREKLKVLLANIETILDGVLKELASNRLSGYYLLSGLETFAGDKASYVALLREVHHFPTNVARRIAVGIAAAEWPEESTGCPKFSNADDVALPVAKLRSPWIEHLMQNFAMLFSRIGVKDNDFDEIKKLVSSLNLGKT